MRRELADRLLRAVMNWDDATDPSKLELIGILNDLATYKYNEYQQYRAGMQFIESLALWLNQFPESDREVALDYVHHRLIFISDREMRHLVEVLLPGLRVAYLASVGGRAPLDSTLSRSSNRSARAVSRRAKAFSISWSCRRSSSGRTAPQCGTRYEPSRGLLLSCSLTHYRHEQEDGSCLS